MKLRYFCIVAALLAFTGAGHGADAERTGDASGSKRLTIPSVEMGGGSLGVSTDKPVDRNVPGFNDPAERGDRVEPFVGLKFTKPLGDK